MKKLIFTVSIFLLLISATFANNIFENYPWLDNLVERENCSTEKVEVYQTGIFNYLLITDADGVATLYNSAGQFYCQSASNFDCVALYNLEGPIDTWDCSTNTSNTCLITITNTQCRGIRIFDENDNLIKTLASGPQPNGPPGQVTPVWEDPRPLGASESRTYIFKNRNFELGRQTVTCENTQIEVASNYFSGCTDAIGLAKLKNVGCRPIVAYNNTLGKIEGTFEPGAEFLLSTGPFLHILTAGMDTLAIITDDNSGTFMEINSGGCDDGGLENCTVSITNTQCRRVGIYDESDNLLTTIDRGPLPNGPPGIVAPVWEDPLPLDEDENRTYIFKENNFVLGRQTVSCANPKIEVASDYFSGCTDAIGRAEITNIGCQTITVYNTNSDVLGTFGPGETYGLSAGPQIYIFLAGADTIGINQNENGLFALDSGGCVGTSNPAIFQEYPWLADLIDPNNCSTEKVDLYQSGIYNYLLVRDRDGISTMYNAAGQFYCQNASNYDCIAAYNLGTPIDSWNCGQVDENCTKYSGTIFFEKCDDGRDFYFIRTSTGEVLDAYYAEGIDFIKYDGQKVNFDYVKADFETPCSIAGQAVIITCIEENNALSQSRTQPISSYNPIDFTLFPNPTQGRFTFQLEDHLENSQELQLVDLLGRTLYQQTIEPFTNSIELDLSPYENGVYYVALHTKGKEVVMRKIVKQGLN